MPSAPRTSIGIGVHRVDDAHVSGQIVSPRRMGGETHGVGTHAVISVAQSQDVVISGVHTRHHHGHIVGFGAGIDEVAHFEIARHGGCEASRVLVDLRVEVNGGRVPEAVDLGV